MVDYFQRFDSVVWPNNNHLASHFVFREHEPLVQGFLDLNRLLFYRGLCLNWAGKMTEVKANDRFALPNICPPLLM